MRKAKENVEKHYAVVGVLEELNKTLTVLEHYVPRFFKGAKDVYWSECNAFFKTHLRTVIIISTVLSANPQNPTQPKPLPDIYLSPFYRGHTILTGVHCSRRGADLLTDQQEHIQAPSGRGRKSFNQASVSWVKDLPEAGIRELWFGCWFW